MRRRLPSADLSTKSGQVHISKINFYTELSHAATRAIKEVVAADPDVSGITRLLAAAKEAVRRVVEEKVVVWGSANQA